MKRIMLALIIVLCVCNLAACSSPKEVEWIGGSIIDDGVTYSVDEFSGSSASVSGDGYTIEYYICDEGPDDCLHNTLGILESDMVKYKDGSRYYSSHLDTEVVLYMPNGKSWVECKLNMTEVGKLSLTQSVEKMYTAGKDLDLRDNITDVIFDKKVDLKVSSYEFKMRVNEVIIPGLVRIKVDDGTIVADEQVKIGDVTVGKKTSEAYDYYQHNGVIVQAVRGTDIASLVTFK